MAFLPNPDGSVTVIDDTGQRPPLVLPPSAVGLAPPVAAPPAVPTAAFPPVAPELVPEPAPAPVESPLLAPTAMAPPPSPWTSATADIPLDVKLEHGLITPEQYAKEKQVQGAPVHMNAPAPVSAGEGGWVGATQPLPPLPPPTAVPQSNIEPPPPPGSAPPTGPAVPAKQPWGGSVAQGLTANELLGKSVVGGYTPPRPARDVVRQFAIKQGAPKLPPELQAEIDAAYNKQITDAEIAGQQEQKAHYALAQAYAENSDAARMEVAKAENRRATEKSIVEGHMATLNQHIADLSKLAARNPVDDMWAAKGAGAQMTAKIGVALAELGSAVTGQPNRAYESVKNDIEQAVQTQKLMIEGGVRTAEAERSALGTLMSSMLSPEAAEAGARAMFFADAEAKTRSLASLLASEKARNDANLLADKFGLDKADAHLQAARLEQNAVSLQGVHQEATAGGYSKPHVSILQFIKEAKGRGFTPEQALAMWDQKNAFPGKMDRADEQRFEFGVKRQVAFPDGTVLYVGNPDMAKEAQSKVRDNSVFMQDAEEVKALIASFGKGVPGTAQRARLKTLLGHMLYMSKKDVLGEALTKGESDFFDSITGQDLGNIVALDSTQLAQLDTIMDESVKRIEAEKKTLYVDPEATQPFAATPAAKAPAGAKKE